MASGEGQATYETPLSTVEPSDIGTMSTATQQWHRLPLDFAWGFCINTMGAPAHVQGLRLQE